MSGALDIPWRQRRGGAGGMQRALESCDFVPITKKAPGVPSTRTSPSPETVEGMDEVQTSSSAKADAHAMPGQRAQCAAPFRRRTMVWTSHRLRAAQATATPTTLPTVSYPSKVTLDTQIDAVTHPGPGFQPQTRFFWQTVQSTTQCAAPFRRRAMVCSPPKISPLTKKPCCAASAIVLVV